MRREKPPQDCGELGMQGQAPFAVAEATDSTRDISKRLTKTLWRLFALFVTCSSAAQAQTLVPYTGGVRAIPDDNPAGIDVALAVNGVGTISDVNFLFNSVGVCDATVGDPDSAVSHPVVGQLIVKLTSPVGTTVTLMNRRGGNRDNICRTTFDDEGGSFLADVTSEVGVAFSGNFFAESALSAFDGQNANGIWTLNISDTSDSGTGELRRFTLVLNTPPRSAINVTRTDDPVPGSCQAGDCSLREAIALANAQEGGDQIVLPAGQYTLSRPVSVNDTNSTGDLNSVAAIEIVGAGQGQTVISQTVGDRLMQLDSGLLSLRDLTLQNGIVVGDGGAVLINTGAARLSNVSLLNNEATGGGGALAGATQGLTILRSTLSGNRADRGGAVDFQSDGAAPLRIEYSTLCNNEANRRGGAISANLLTDDFFQVLSSVRIERSTVCSNRVTSESTSDYGGGGVAVSTENFTGGELIITRSTFNNNSALRGGAIRVFRESLVLHSNTLAAPITQIVGTEGSLLYHTGFLQDDLRFTNNILVGRCVYTDSAVIPNSSSHNLESSSDTCRLNDAAFPINNQVSVSSAILNLGALANNGGPTQTRLPGASSAAIDAGSQTNCIGPDQRNFAITDGDCDIGALEVGGLADLIFANGFE